MRLSLRYVIVKFLLVFIYKEFIQKYWIRIIGTADVTDCCLEIEKFLVNFKYMYILYYTILLCAYHENIMSDNSMSQDCS